MIILYDYVKQDFGKIRKILNGFIRDRVFSLVFYLPSEYNTN